MTPGVIIFSVLLNKQHWVIKTPNMLSLIQILVALTTKGDALIVVEAWVLSLSKMQGDMLNLFARLMPWMPHFCGPVYNWQINYFSFNIDHPTYTWSIYALIQTSLGNKLIFYTLYFIHLNVDILSLVWSLMVGMFSIKWVQVWVLASPHNIRSVPIWVMQQTHY